MPNHTSSPAALRVVHQPWETPLTEPDMSNTEDRHKRYRLTNRHVEVDGAPAIPVSGELHFSRVPRRHWEERLRLIKAGGITVVATYVFWIHHEPDAGRAGFADNLDVAAFVALCAEVGLDVVLRIGPWCHGEVRNGGFPDWVQAADVQHRTDDPAYLALVEAWFGLLGRELSPLVGAGSNVIGIQLENELYDQPGHLITLKRLARAAGLSAPIWTATAWGGAELPEGEVLPLFGGYGDGFWVDADAPWDPTFREHFFFSHSWDDPGIGADLREHLGAGGPAAAPRAASALFPPATCELAGGMATAYQRRPRPQGADVAAVAANKIGNGSAWQGYYMFAGGRNPGDGLQESQATGYPNDLPRFDYDFHAPIGATGRLAGSFAALRRQHAFLAAFGDRLALMPSSLPAVMPAGVDDSATLRWALRSDGSAGFVFVTWHQPHVPLDTCRGAQFEVTLDAGTVTFPAAPVDIPAGTIACWPVNLTVAGVRIDWATATPLTILDPGSTVPTLVLAAGHGIPVDLKFAPGTTVSSIDLHNSVPGGPAGKHQAGGLASGAGLASDAGLLPEAGLRPGADGVWRVSPAEPQLLTAVDGSRTLDILVLPAETADQAWVLAGELVLSDEPVWTVPGGLAGRSQGRPSLQRYSPDRRGFAGVDVAVPLPAEAEVPGFQAGNDAVPRVVPAVLTRVAAPVPASFGSAANRAAAPSPETIAELAAEYSLSFPVEGVDGHHTELEMEWAGDVAQLLVDGVPVADRFWDGSPWVLDLADAGITPGSAVTLQILPLHAEAQVGLPVEARVRREATDGDLAALDSVRLVHWHRWLEAGAGQ
ncbi:beta-galactosidase [Arthrobacter sp. ZBG10]|uniref:beta-galactosidase n=1 Tax=Arthrobacter sp. ZBG10 TaxID=1676590 RepID=UPI00067FB255|nr:beta-galactosidase [Arthrobacter sp. ZBG10]KNH18004.1 beta-galactosidase [Arthrobacter sp. ZBG10]